MFIYSIIPIHLLTDSDRIAINSANSVDVAEHRVMELEALYSALIVRQYLGKEIPQVSNTFYEGVKLELDKARASELALRASSGEVADNDSVARLNEVLRIKQMTEQRIADLQALQNYLLGNGPAPTYVISGVDNLNLDSVTKELAMALKYKEELTASEQFWHQIATIQLQTLQDEQADESEDGTDNQVQIQEDPNYNPGGLSPEELSQIAASKIRISELRSLLSIIMPSKTMDELVSMEEALQRELSNESYKAQGQYKNQSESSSNSSIGKIPGIQANIKFVVAQINTLKILNGIQTGLMSDLSEVIYVGQSYV
ncbi:MAG: hypothetical protein A3B68_04520 [Candidatus Melainabacteria bacterium RIFCSPHIGHO2_02_FULL_34_12]|nr:MAG: hypothetical protein A3B68_04520 [Candidatus Melainabacteria bacterium RIFCSPHIGHO2_02_FULL_34_12]